MSKRKTTAWLLRMLFVAVVAGASGGWSTASALPDHSANFPVEFTDCVESIGRNTGPDSKRTLVCAASIHPGG
jgi:hypothetical protein